MAQNNFFNIKNNLQAIRAYRLDTKCVKTNHADYDYCLMVANTFPDNKTLVTKIVQPIYNKWIISKTGEWK